METLSKQKKGSVSLAEIAKASAQDKQTEMLLHGATDKQNKYSGPKAPSAVKSVASHSSGKGKQHKKRGYKKSSQGKCQTGQTTKRSSQSGFKGQAAGDQQS